MKSLLLILLLLLPIFCMASADESDATTKPNVQGGFKDLGLEGHSIIDPHLEAYNDNNYEEFKALFHDEIEAYEFPDKLLFKGKASFEENYKALVATISKSAFISERIIEGSFVVDMETVKIQVPEAGEQVIGGLVIYQMKDNLIYRMMFLKEEQLNKP